MLTKDRGMYRAESLDDLKELVGRMKSESLQWTFVEVHYKDGEVPAQNELALSLMCQVYTPDTETPHIMQLKLLE